MEISVQYWICHWLAGVCTPRADLPWPLTSSAISLPTYQAHYISDISSLYECNFSSVSRYFRQNVFERYDKCGLTQIHRGHSITLNKHIYTSIFNLLAPKRCASNFKSAVSEYMLRTEIMHFLWNRAHVNITKRLWWYINFGSGNCLMLADKKPLPDPMLAMIFVTIWRHQYSTHIIYSTSLKHDVLWFGDGWRIYASVI